MAIFTLSWFPLLREIPRLLLRVHSKWDALQELSLDLHWMSRLPLISVQSHWNQNGDIFGAFQSTGIRMITGKWPFQPAHPASRPRPSKTLARLLTLLRTLALQGLSEYRAPHSVA